MTRSLLNKWICYIKSMVCKCYNFKISSLAKNKRRSSCLNLPIMEEKSAKEETPQRHRKRTKKLLNQIQKQVYIW